MTSIGTTAAKLWPFLYVQDGRQPPSWILSNRKWCHSIRRPENHSLGPNMEWIGCTVCEIFVFKLPCDLETGVRGHSRSSKVGLFDRAHTTLYSSSIVTMPLASTLSEVAAYWSKIASFCYPPPLYLAPPLGVKPSDLRNDLWCR